MPENLKPLVFLGNSQRSLQNLTESARRKFGYALHVVQLGNTPDNAKPLSGFSVRLHEIRIRDNTESYRAVYTVALGDAVYLLHAFHKKSKKGIGIPQQDLDIIRQRLKEAIKLEAENNE